MEKNLLDSSLGAINPDISAKEGGKTQIEGSLSSAGKERRGQCQPCTLEGKMYNARENLNMARGWREGAMEELLQLEKGDGFIDLTSCRSL